MNSGSPTCIPIQGARGIETRWLGRMLYKDALALQEETVARKTAEPDAADELLLLEHEPVYTIGRTSDRSSLHPASDLFLNKEKLPYPLIEISRGGHATFHGPGQLVGYPILDLRRRGQDLHLYLRSIEEALIETLHHCRVEGTRREGFTGVWVGSRKIASIGVGVRRWVSMHGFALNVCGDLTPFSYITPCGISGVEMTSIERETAAIIDVQTVAGMAARAFEKRIFRVQLDPLKK